MAEKSLRRSTEHRWIAGVCGGIADYTGADVTVVRLIVAAATVLGLGAMIIFYAVAWLVIPNERSQGGI